MSHTPIDHGGPAFPLNASDAWGGPTQGMTLRQYIAIKVLAGWCANPNVVINPETSPGEALVLADAMIEAGK